MTQIKVCLLASRSSLKICIIHAHYLDQSHVVFCLVVQMKTVPSVKVLVSAWLGWYLEQSFSTTHSAFLSPSANTSHGFGAFPKDVTHTFISDRYVTFSSFLDKTAIVSY